MDVLVDRVELVEFTYLGDGQVGQFCRSDLLENTVLFMHEEHSEVLDHLRGED